MNFIVDHVGELAHQLAPAIEHAAQDFRRHDQDGRLRINSNVTRHESHVTKLDTAILVRANTSDDCRANDIYIPLLVNHETFDWKAP